MSERRSPLARAAFESIPIYTPDERQYPINLSDNSNQWGVPPTAERVLRESRVSLARYPDAYSRLLKDALAEYCGVQASKVVVGCGSDDVLDAAIRAFAEPGERIAVLDPTFVMIPVFGRLNSLVPVMVPLMADYDVDIERTLATAARITYLCSPNNPTGQPLRRPSIEAILAHAPGLVIVDEAYAEFAGDSIVDLLDKYERLLICRTMSKAFGLAGLRVGYGIGAPSLIREIERSRGPYKVSRLADVAAIAALTHDRSWMNRIVAEARANREQFRTLLQTIGLEPLRSSANFVLVPVCDPMTVGAAMRERGVSIRPFQRLAFAQGASLAKTDGGAIRITIGRWEQMEKTFRAIKESLV